jgi:hypothetical protein
MSIRPFDWRDLSTLHRFRHESVFLDTALLLTRGPLMMPGALFSYLAPSMGVFTCVSNGKSSIGPVIGQFMHLLGSPFAHITFFAPQTRLDGSTISGQVEYMMIQLGERGAMRLLADVDEGSFAYDALREIGFATYTRQRVWQWTGHPMGAVQRPTWREAVSQDVIPIRVLYNNLVPGLVQQIEPFATQRPKGMVYYEQGDLLAYVELKYGHRGIWAQPFVHPDAENVGVHLVDMLSKIPNRRSRPVYLCVRSYQAWLEAAIEDLGAEAGPRQAVMAKQLVVQYKARHSFALPALEGGQPEITAPVVRLESK